MLNKNCNHNFIIGMKKGTAHDGLGLSHAWPCGLQLTIGGRSQITPWARISFRYKEGASAEWRPVNADKLEVKEENRLEVSSPQEKALLETFRFAGPRMRTLQQLWSELCAYETLPQVDRWLATRLKQDKRFGQRDRKWYAEAIFSLMRYGVTAAAGEELEQDEVPRFDAHESVWVRRSGDEWWLEMRKLPLERLVRWTEWAGERHAKMPNTVPLSASAQRLFKGQSLVSLLACEGIPPMFAAALAQRADLSRWPHEKMVYWIAQQNERAPLWLRLNVQSARGECEKQLVSDGFALHWDGADAFYVQGTKGIYGTRPFEKGLIEVQDLASQAIGSQLALGESAFVWDACAGGGGKTIQLASRLKGRGAVYASDVRAYKLDEVKKRAARAGFTNIRYLAWDGRSAPELPRAVKNHGGFDAILIDAPCSASGTWRRNPDARFRMKSEFIEELTAIQKGILPYVLGVLRPGGFIVYATCSWLPDENEKVVEEWLRTSPDLQLETMGMVGAPDSNADTMFVASLRKC
jgi:16S rRNA (cytosine967-C5)-methyltransferase